MTTQTDAAGMHRITSDISGVLDRRVFTGSPAQLTQNDPAAPGLVATTARLEPTSDATNVFVRASSTGLRPVG